MAAQSEQLLRHIRRLASRPALPAEADAVLLDRFIRHRDEDAFAALVHRHAPLVLGVCRRVLGHAQQAEDAAQAVFLVLARKAATISPPDRLAAWLHGLARHVAWNARRTDERRRRQETRSARSERARRPADPLDQLTARELLNILDEELQRLPDVYRLPLILCCLEGRSQEQAAAQLNWTAGSVKGRLERGRAKLHRRLAKRGVALPAALLAMEAVQGMPAAAGMAMEFVASTLQAAAIFTAGAAVTDGRIATEAVSLAEEGMRSLAATKSKIMAALLVAVGVAAGAGTLAHQMTAARQPEAKQAAQADQETKNAEPAKAKESARTDRYGDPLPLDAIARLGTIRLRRGHTVFALPENDAFLSVLHTGERIEVRKWRMNTGELLHHSEFPFSRGGGMAVSADGQTLAATGYDRELPQVDAWIRLWDLPSGKVIGELKGASWAQSLSFSPNGKMIAAAVQGEPLRLLDCKTGTRLRRFEGAEDSWGPLAFSPDGKTLAAASGTRRTVRLWDTATGKQLHAFDDGPGPALQNYVVFSPDGKTMATASGGEKTKTIHLWDVATGKEVRQFENELGTGSLTFSPDGKILAAGSTSNFSNLSKDMEEPRLIHLWDVATGREAQRLPAHVSSVSSLAYSQDGKRLVSGGGTVMKVWDVVTGKEVVPLTEHEDWVNSVAFTPDGRNLASSGLDGSIRLWEPATGKQVRVFEGGVRPRVFRIAFAPDGRTLTSDRPDGSLRIWDVATGREIRRLQVGEEGYPCLFAYSPDGRNLAVRSKDGTIRLLDVATGVEKRQFTGGLELGKPLCFSPDGGKLASISFAAGGGGSIVQVWDVATGAEKRKWTSTFHIPIVFSSDGKTLFGVMPDERDAAAHRPECRLRLWNIAGGQDRTSKIEKQAESLAISPDGRMLAWSDFDGTITIWELAAGQVRRHFKDSHFRIASLAFSPDSKTLASGGADTTILVWDVTGRLAGERSGPVSAAQRVSLWRDLASEDAAKAFDAMGLLTASPQQAVSLVKDKLKPVPAPDPKQIARLIADLDSERFQVRQKAMEELKQLGELVEPALRDALQGKLTEEARNSVEKLLEGVRMLSASPGRLRDLRAVEILERVETPQARQALQALAEGAPTAQVTREAKAALERLGKRSMGKP